MNPTVELLDELKEYFVLSDMTITADCFDNERQSRIAVENRPQTVKHLDASNKIVFSGAPRLVKRFVKVRSNKREFDNRLKRLEVCEVRLAEREFHIKQIVEKYQENLQSSLLLIDVIEGIVSNHLSSQDIEADGGDVAPKKIWHSNEFLNGIVKLSTVCNDNRKERNQRYASEIINPYKSKMGECEMTDSIINPNRNRKAYMDSLAYKQQANCLFEVDDIFRERKEHFELQLQNGDEDELLRNDIGVSETQSHFQRHVLDIKHKGGSLINRKVFDDDCKVGKSSETCDSVCINYTQSTDDSNDSNTKHTVRESYSSPPVITSDGNITINDSGQSLENPMRSHKTNNTLKLSTCKSFPTKKQHRSKTVSLNEVRSMDPEHLSPPSESTHFNCLKTDVENEKLLSLSESNMHEKEEISPLHSNFQGSSGSIERKHRKTCDEPVLEISKTVKSFKDDKIAERIPQHLRDFAFQGFSNLSSPFKDPLSSSDNSPATNYFSSHVTLRMDRCDESDHELKHQHSSTKKMISEPSNEKQETASKSSTVNIHPATEVNSGMLKTVKTNKLAPDVQVGTSKFNLQKHSTKTFTNKVWKTRKPPRNRPLSSSESSLNLNPPIKHPSKSRKNSKQRAAAAGKPSDVDEKFHAVKLAVPVSISAFARATVPIKDNKSTKDPLTTFNNNEQTHFNTQKSGDKALHKSSTSALRSAISVSNDEKQYSNKEKIANIRSNCRTWKAFWGPNTFGNSVSNLNNPSVNVLKTQHLVNISQKTNFVKSTNIKTSWKRTNLNGLSDNVVNNSLEGGDNKIERIQCEKPPLHFEKYETGDSTHISSFKQTALVGGKSDLTKKIQNKGEGISFTDSKIRSVPMENENYKRKTQQSLNRKEKARKEKSNLCAGKMQYFSEDKTSAAGQEETARIQSKSTCLNKSQFTNTVKPTTRKVKEHDKCSSKAFASQQLKSMTADDNLLEAKSRQRPIEERPGPSNKSRKGRTTESPIDSPSNNIALPFPKPDLFEHKDAIADSPVVPVDRHGTKMARKILEEPGKVLVAVSEIGKPNSATLREKGLTFEEYELAFGYRPKVTRTPDIP